MTFDPNHLPFVPAHRSNYGDGPVLRTIDWIVVHDMEMPEAGTTAESCAAFFGRDHGAPSSAHVCVDNNSGVQCVRDHDIAFAAPGANGYGLHIEHAGYAKQNSREWGDAYSTAMLRDISAPIAAAKARKHGIPLVWLGVNELKAGRRGFTSHANVTAAFHQSTHSDPGPDFPVVTYMGWVRQAAVVVGRPAAPKPPAPVPAKPPAPAPAAHPAPTVAALTIIRGPKGAYYHLAAGKLIRIPASAVPKGVPVIVCDTAAIKRYKSTFPVVG